MIGFLKKHDIRFVSEKRFDELPDHRFDFYLPYRNLIIEVHGKQHYKPYTHFGRDEKFKQTIENDRIKKEFVLSRGISYECIDTRDFKNELKRISNELLFI